MSYPESSPASARVLLIDDDKELCHLVRDYLQPLGYELSMEHTGPDGLDRALAETFHAVILDVMLPGMNGLEVLQRLRPKSDVPILMLTARGEEPDRIAGLEMGADDYLPKTFSTRELLARLRAVIRRAAREPGKDEAALSSELAVGELRMQPEARIAVLGDRKLDLSALEFDLLLCLARARGRVKSREQLLEEVAERNYEVFDRSVDVHIWALRKKLGDDAQNPKYIRTLRSVGYMFINPEHETS
ncbi:response regulator transcription factor [Kiritimatiellaeota bacterium B1221]|nr:response regulator transcription factor [Kiritimatiellaeota bacterium B1221]